MSTSCRQEDTAHTYYTHQFVSHSVAARFQLFTQTVRARLPLRFHMSGLEMLQS
jgi:hypothetical protein